MKTKQYIIKLIAVTLFFITGCGKGFLEQKPNTDIIIPATLEDLQQLLDFTELNGTSALPQLSCDDYFIISEQDWLGSFTATERHAYIWDEDVFGGEINRREWNVQYRSIFYANGILSQLGNIKVNDDNLSQYNCIKGQAYFVRAFSFFDLAINFAPAYDGNTADTEMGIPLKLSPNVDEIAQRSTLKETYDQIISDLTNAVELLELVLPTIERNRASRPSAYAFFSRLYLSMGDYSNAELYADSCLALYNKLIDYNTIDRTSLTPFTDVNDESIFYAIQVGTGYGNALPNFGNINIDTVLLDSYNPGDLRREIYFVTDPVSGLTRSKRRYAAASINTYAGIATDEIYLIKAECAARRGDVPTSMEYLNALLINRYVTGMYTPYSTSISQQEALALIIDERRKELVWRSNLRWIDLKRLNKEGANITLVRKLGDKIYTLTPNSPRYTFNIPADEIERSGIQQNIR